jgi:hypothetical protein
MRSMLEDKTVTCLDMLTELQKSKDATFVATAYTPPPPICLVAGDSPEVPTSAVKSAVVAAARPTVPKRHEIAMISAAEEHRVAEISALELASYKCHNCNAMGHLMYLCPEPYNETNLAGNGQQFTAATWDQYRKNYLSGQYQRYSSNRRNGRDNGGGRRRDTRNGSGRGHQHST